MLAKGVPVAPALRVEEVFRDPHMAANRMTTEFSYPLLEGMLAGVRSLGDFDAWDGGYARSAPLVDEHSSEILAEYGYASDEIERLRPYDVALSSGNLDREPVGEVLRRQSGRLRPVCTGILGEPIAGLADSHHDVIPVCAIE